VLRNDNFLAFTGSLKNELNEFVIFSVYGVYVSAVRVQFADTGFCCSVLNGPHLLGAHTRKTLLLDLPFEKKKIAKCATQNQAFLEHSKHNRV